MRSRALVSTRFTLPLKGRSKEARRPSKIVKVWRPVLSAIGLATAILASSATPAFALATHLYDSKTSSEFGSTPGALGVAIDQSDGSVYVAELNNGSVNKFTATGELVSSFGGGEGKISFAGPWGLAVDQTSHDFYITTEGNGSVYKYDSEGNPVSSFGTEGKVAISTPIGVAVDPANGDVYVASREQSKIEIFTPSGALVSKFSTAPVTSPLGVAIDGSGRVYVDGGGFGGPGGIERFSDTGTPEELVQSGSFQGVTVDSATEDVYASQGGEIDEYRPGGESLISKFGGGILNDAWGVAVNKTSGEIYAGTYYGSSVDAFGPLVTLPDVVTYPPVPAVVGHTSASLTGHVDPAGGPTITACEVEYGLNTEYSSGKVPCETSTPISAPTDVSAKLTGLTALTIYHYRFIAKNENGTNFGEDQTLEPQAVIEVNTGAATEVGASEAKLNGSFQIDSEGGPTKYYFEWGPTKAYGDKTLEITDSTDGLQEVSAGVTGLNFYSVYHYRMVATNGFGTNHGPDQTLRTESPGLPTVDATSASALSPSGATLEAAVNPDSASTVVRFEYGTSPSYGSKTPLTESVGMDSIDHPVTATITGLQPGETYHYRAVAVNFAGLSAGPDRTFNTTDTPTISATAASAISQTAATLGGQIKPGFSPTTYHFEYGTSALYGHSAGTGAALEPDNLLHNVSSTISSLTPATTYHYRIVAANGVGASDGPDLTFTTASAPESGKGTTPPICKRGRISKRGKCVRKPHHRVRHHRRADAAGAGR